MAQHCGCSRERGWQWLCLAFAFGEAAGMNRSWRRIAVIVFALPVFLFFPLGVAMLAMTGKQLIWGFDDMPIGAMLLGLLAGVAIALPAFIFVSLRAWRGLLRTPLIVTAIVAAFDRATIPIARWITERVEHPERFSTLVPNKPAESNAEIAPQLPIGHHWPGVGEPGLGIES